MVGSHADGIDLAATEGVLESHRLLLPPLCLRFTNSPAARINHLLLPRLGIMHLQQTDVGQLGNSFIIDLNGYDVVLVGCDGEGLQEGMLVEEVAQHEGDASPLDGSRHILEGISDVCLLTLGLVVEEFADDIEDVLAAFLGRDELLNLVGEEDYADLVVVLNGREGERGRNLGHHVTLELLDGTEVETATDVNQQHNRQLAFLLEDLDVRLSKASRHVPLDVANIVAVLVLAHFGESHAAPLEGRVVLARKDVAAQATSLNLNLPDLL